LTDEEDAAHGVALNADAAYREAAYVRRECFQVQRCVANAGRIESGDSYKFYAEGVTPAVARLYEAINAERVAVAAALGTSVPSLADWFERVYGVREASLVETCQRLTSNNDGPYQATRTPNTRIASRPEARRRASPPANRGWPATARESHPATAARHPTPRPWHRHRSPPASQQPAGGRTRSSSGLRPQRR